MSQAAAKQAQPVLKQNRLILEQVNSQQFNEERQNSSQLVVGSRVQFGDPPQYGTIRWMGNVPQVIGIIAGVEMVRYCIKRMCKFFFITRVSFIK